MQFSQLNPREYAARCVAQGSGQSKAAYARPVVRNLPMRRVIEALEVAAPREEQLIDLFKVSVDQIDGATAQHMKHGPFLPRQIPVEHAVDDVHSFPDIMG